MDKIVYNGMTEEEISKSATCSYYYANYVLKGRFELGEKAISKSAMCSYYYASDVLKGRFKLGEKEIATDPLWSYWYAKDVLKGRFEIGEKAIFDSNNTYYAVRHLDFLLKIELKKQWTK